MISDGVGGEPSRVQQQLMMLVGKKLLSTSRHLWGGSLYPKDGLHRCGLPRSLRSTAPFDRVGPDTSSLFHPLHFDLPFLCRTPRGEQAFLQAGSVQLYDADVGRPQGLTLRGGPRGHFCAQHWQPGPGRAGESWPTGVWRPNTHEVIHKRLFFLLLVELARNDTLEG